MPATARKIDHAPCESGLPVPPGSPGTADAAIAAGWLSVDQVAEALGLSERAVRGRCSTWQARAQAVALVTDGGKPAWYVSPHADARLAHRDDPALAAWNVASDESRLRGERRRRWLLAWRSACSAEPRTPARKLAERIVAQARAAGAKCSVRSLQFWSKRYDACGLAGLLDGNMNSDSDRTAGAEPGVGRSARAIRFFYSLFHTQQRLSVTVCHEYTVAESVRRGWRWPASVRSTQLWLRQRDNLAVTCLARHGYARYISQYGSYVEQDYDAVAPGDLYVADSHLVKAVCRHDGRIIRPWFVVNLDASSRCVTGWSLGPLANQDAILSALRASYVRWAICHTQKIDNGKDYGARLFHGRSKAERRPLAVGAGRCAEQGRGSPPAQRDGSPDQGREASKAECDRLEWRGILPELGVKAQFAQPYNPQSKLVERFFRTFTDRLIRLLATFVDTDPARRPDCHQLVVARASDVTCAESDVPTLDELRDLIRNWIADDYHQRAHHGDAMRLRSPLAVWQADASSLRQADADGLHLLMQIRGTFKVAKNGVRLTIGGRGFGFGRDDERLCAWKGREVLVALDEEDVSQVAVFTPDRQLITVARMNERIAPFGADAQTLRESIRTVTRARGNQKKARRTAALAMQTPQQVLRERQVRALKDDGPPPPDDGTAVQPVHTAFEAASSRVGTLRKAAGAESMSAAPGGDAYESLDDLVGGVTVDPRQNENLDELVRDVELDPINRTDAFTLVTEAMDDELEPD